MSDEALSKKVLDDGLSESPLDNSVKTPGYETFYDAGNEGTASELHVMEREIGWLQQEITHLEKELRDLHERRSAQERMIQSMGQKMQGLRREQAEGGQVLESLKKAAARCESDQEVLMSYTQTDDSSVVTDLLLAIKKKGVEVWQKRQSMDKEWETTGVTELQWNRTEEAIGQVCAMRQQLTGHWQASVGHMTKRDRDMDLCIMMLSMVKEEVEEKQGRVRRAQEVLDGLMRRNQEASRRIEAMLQQTSKEKAELQDQERRCARLQGECEGLQCSMDRTGAKVKMTQTQLTHLTTHLQGDRDRLEKARVHRTALQEKLKSDTEAMVSAEEKASRAEQEVKEVEWAARDTEARLFRHQKALSLMAEELQGLMSKDKRQQASISANRSVLARLSRQQREAERAISRKQEAMNKLDSQLEVLERRMTELSEGEEFVQMKLLKEKEAQISMAVEDKRKASSAMRRDQQKEKGELRLAKRKVEKAAAEKRDLSHKVEDLELITAATERELSEVTQRKKESLIVENQLKLEAQEAQDRLQSGKDQLVSLETQRLQLEAGFREKEAELACQKEAVRLKLRQATQACQKTRVQLNHRLCKVQKHRAAADCTRPVGGAEESLQLRRDRMRRQREQLQLKRQGLAERLALKEREIEALEITLSVVQSHTLALSTDALSTDTLSTTARTEEECEERKVLEQKLQAVEEKHAHKTSQLNDIKEEVKCLRASLDALLQAEREELGRRELIQDLRSEIHAQEDKLNEALDQCCELIGLIQTEKMAASLIQTEKMAAGLIQTEKMSASLIQTEKMAAGLIQTEKMAASLIQTEKMAAGMTEGDLHHCELRELSDTLEILLLDIMDQQPDLRSAVEEGLALPMALLVWDPQCGGECASVCSGECVSVCSGECAPVCGGECASVCSCVSSSRSSGVSGSTEFHSARETPYSEEEHSQSTKSRSSCNSCSSAFCHRACDSSSSDDSIKNILTQPISGENAEAMAASPGEADSSCRGDIKTSDLQSHDTKPANQLLERPSLPTNPQQDSRQDKMSVASVAPTETGITPLLEWEHQG